jgi:ribonuclease HI
LSLPNTQEQIERIRNHRATANLATEPENPPKTAGKKGKTAPQAPRDWIGGLILSRNKEYIPNANAFMNTIDETKMIHVVTDGGAKQNPGAAGCGILVRQSRLFTTMWKHYPHATNNTMEHRAVAEALAYLPPGMVVWVSSDSQYFRKGVLEWIHKWKRNGWKNSKKQGVANAVLWRELNAAIARHSRVDFTFCRRRHGSSFPAISELRRLQFALTEQKTLIG